MGQGFANSRHRKPPGFRPSKVSLGPNANVPRIKRQEMPSLEVIRELLAELANDLEVSKADYATTSLENTLHHRKQQRRKLPTYADSLHRLNSSSPMRLDRTHTKLSRVSFKSLSNA